MGMKGVSLRVEIGPRDIANNTCVFVRRDLGNKESVSSFNGHGNGWPKTG